MLLTLDHAAAAAELPELAEGAFKAIISGWQTVAKSRQGPDAANHIQVSIAWALCISEAMLDS